MFLSLEMETLAHRTRMLLGQNANQHFQFKGNTQQHQKPGDTQDLCIIPKHMTLS